MVSDTGAPSRSRGRRTAKDWVDAGWSAFVEGGLDAVAVEPVAVRLGATKGSFYWHFADRAALVEAVLARWLAKTDEIIAALAVIEEPRRRLDELFTGVFADPSWARTETDLFGRVGNPAVETVVRAATDRRVRFMGQALRETGLDEEAAADGALQAYALWIGLLQLAAAVPGAVPTGDAYTRFTASTRTLLAHLYAAVEERQDGGVGGRVR